MQLGRRLWRTTLHTHSAQSCNVLHAKSKNHLGKAANRNPHWLLTEVRSLATEEALFTRNHHSLLRLVFFKHTSALFWRRRVSFSAEMVKDDTATGLASRSLDSGDFLKIRGEKNNSLRLVKIRLFYFTPISNSPTAWHNSSIDVFSCSIHLPSIRALLRATCDTSAAKVIVSAGKARSHPNPLSFSQRI